MRRSTLDIALGRSLTIGATWTDSDGVDWQVVQIHRADCHVELRRAPARRLITFEDLRTHYEQADSLHLEAA